MTGMALKNPIAVLMFCIAAVVFALQVTPRLSVDTFPELTPPVLVVGTQVPGLGAKDMEKTITWRVEKYVSATPGVDHVESSSRNGLSVVFVWLKWGVDLNAAQTLVQQQVAFAMAAVPKSLGVIPPFVLQYDPSNAPVVQVVVSGGGLSGAQLFDFAQNNIEPVLEGIPGVASAAPNGGRQRQINVVVDPVAAQARNVTSSDIAAAISRANALLPAGAVLSDQFHANVYTNAVARQVKDMANALVKMTGDHPVLVRDVARVEDGGAPNTQAVSVDGLDAVYLNVLRVPGGNTLDIVESVKRAIAGLGNLPTGLIVRPVFDQSTFVRTAYHGLKQEVVQALVLISIIILLFLQSVRGTLIVSLAIPLSFAVTLVVLYATGQTLNSFTLGGLTLAMGRLVDDAVVVLESIHRQQSLGKSPHHAALDGAQAVALPVLASTLTTMAVLLPIILLAGLAKKLFVPLAITVAVAMMASYVVSVTVTPVACRYFMGHVAQPAWARVLERVINGFANAYARVLRRVLPWGWAVGCAAVVLVGAAVQWSGRLPSSFFPDVDESMERVYVRFAPGTSLETAAVKMNAMGKLLKEKLPPGAVELVLTNVGSPGNARSAMTSPNNGPHMGFIRLELAGPEERKQNQREISDAMRTLLNDAFPGVQFLQWPGGLVASVFANGYIAPLVLEVRGEDFEHMREQMNALAEVARSVPGIRDIYPSMEINYPEFQVDTDRQLAGEVGVDARQVAQATLEATLGNINAPGVWIDPGNGQSYYVVTSYDALRLGDGNGFDSLPLRFDEEGRAVSLGTYAHVGRGLGPVAVERNQLQRAAHLMMQVERRDLGSAAAELEQRLHADPRTANVAWEFVGQVKLMRDTFAGLGSAILLAVMLVFMIMASQFKSLKLPLIMLATIPVCSVGVVIALVSAGQGFSITALMGLLMVVGIAVSNGILMVDDANHRLTEGAPIQEAVVEAARSRFVPILMTSLATVIGLIPTAMGLEAGTEANQPLALVVVGGLTSSTFLSLFLVPVLFVAMGKRAPEQPAHHAELAAA